jgi:hypothetical protein
LGTLSSRNIHNGEVILEQVKLQYVGLLLLDIVRDGPEVKYKCNSSIVAF